jgi:hypothetical protein
VLERALDRAQLRAVDAEQPRFLALLVADALGTPERSASRISSIVISSIHTTLAASIGRSISFMFAARRSGAPAWPRP